MKSCDSVKDSPLLIDSYREAHTLIHIIAYPLIHIIAHTLIHIIASIQICIIGDADFNHSVKVTLARVLLFLF